MAIAVDASSPAIATGTGTGALATASFTPPNGSLVLAVAIAGWTSAGTTTIAISDSLAGTWTSRLTENSASNNSTDFGGCIQISSRTGTGSAMTVTMTPTFGSGTAGGTHLAVYVLTGASTSSFGGTGVVNTTASVNGLTVSLTTTQIGSISLGGFIENKGSGRTISASTNTTLTTGLSGTNPYNNTTDAVDTAFVKSSAVTSTLTTSSYAITWSGSTGVGKGALLEILPGTSNISAADATSNIIDSAVTVATVPATTDTGSGADLATTSQLAVGADTGSGVDAAVKITNVAAEVLSSSEAADITSGGATIAFGNDVATAVESASIRTYDTESLTSLEIALPAIQGTLNPGQRIVRVQAEDRTDYVVR